MSVDILLTGDKKFLPGLRVLAYSVLANNTLSENQRIVVLAQDDEVLNDLVLNQLVTLERIELEPYAAMNLPGKIHKHSLCKIVGFLPRNTDWTIVIDADVLCTGDISKLWEPSTCNLKMWPEKQQGGHNAGVIAISSRIQSRELHDAMLAIPKDLLYRPHLADQSVIEYMVLSRYLEVEDLPLEYNCSHRSLDKLELRQMQARLKKVKLLHFLAGKKPWEHPISMGWSHQLWRAYENDLSIKTQEHDLLR